MEDDDVSVNDDDYNNYRDAKYMLMWAFDLDNIRWWE